MIELSLMELIATNAALIIYIQEVEKIKDVGTEQLDRLAVLSSARSAQQKVSAAMRKFDD